MLRSGQFLSQKQTLGQKLSRQQIQFIKMLQLPTMAMEQRIKEEIEMNPVLEEGEPDEYDSMEDWEISEREEQEEDRNKDEFEELEVKDDVSELDDIDWDEYTHADEIESYKAPVNPDEQEYRDLPKPYEMSLLEELENQVALLGLSEREQLIADQILGSLDDYGYFKRELQSVVDFISFNHQTYVTEEEVELVLHKIQQLDPPGIAARDTRECLLLQLKQMGDEVDFRELAIAILDEDWASFEKKHFEKLMQRHSISEIELKEVIELIRHLDPKPGLVEYGASAEHSYITPDFKVEYDPQLRDDHSDDPLNGFVIELVSYKDSSLTISSKYRQMWEELNRTKNSKTRAEVKQTRKFIKEKLDSAKWFIDSLQQRRYTLLNVMSTMVLLQKEFFMTGKKVRPMILRDIADRIQMDISTVSRVVNGKYVQTPFGVYELKYFFNEGIETDSGEEVANREIKNILQTIVDEEDKRKPLSDDALSNALKEKGYKIARRTISKYREQLGIPVARLRREVM